jgi:hypothetical protein
VSTCQSPTTSATWTREQAPILPAYSEDVRKKKIVEAVERGMPKIEAARAFGAGISSVKRYVASYREGRSLVPNKRPGSKPKLWTGAQGSCWRRTSESAPRGHAGAEARVPAARSSRGGGGQRLHGLQDAGGRLGWT